MATDITISVRAFCKMLLHVFKYPHCALNGIFLAEKPKEDKSVTIVDAIPLFHLTLGLTPMVEIALMQVDQYCKSSNLIIAGYYQANENYTDNLPDHIANRLSDKVLENFPLASMVMINNEKLSIDCDQIPFVLYHNQEGKWTPKDNSSVHLECGPEALDAACTLMHSRIYRKITDFDNHLDDVANDWLNPSINTEIFNIL